VRGLQVPIPAWLKAPVGRICHRAGNRTACLGSCIHPPQTVMSAPALSQRRAKPSPGLPWWDHPVHCRRVLLISSAGLVVNFGGRSLSSSACHARPLATLVYAPGSSTLVACWAAWDAWRRAPGQLHQPYRHCRGSPHGGGIGHHRRQLMVSSFSIRSSMAGANPAGRHLYLKRWV